MKKKIKDLTLKELIIIHNSMSCHKCPLKDDNGNCIRTGLIYTFSDDFLEQEIEVEKYDLHKENK